MITLTDKGQELFNKTESVSINEIRAIHSISFEQVTESNFAHISGLPNPVELLASLRKKGYIKGK